MKTELIHSYSTASLSALAKSDSSLSLSTELHPGGGSYSPTPTKDDTSSTLGLAKTVAKEWWEKTCRRKTVERKFPLIRWLPKYTTDKLISDIVAGFTVGLTILPQGLAYATVGGLPPQYGLYSGFIGCFVYILLGGTAEITIGPTAIMAIITFTYTHGKPPAYSVILCFLTGIVTLLMGIFQLGFIVNFISTPVNSGFTSAAAITICSTQIKGLLGLKFAAEGFLPTVTGAIQHIHEVKLWDSILSLICIIVLLVLMKLQLLLRCLTNRFNWMGKPLWFISTARNAIVVIVATAVAAIIGPSQPFTIVGHIVPGLPEITVPPFTIIDPATNATHTFSQILEEEASAIIVLPLLALMEHITIAKEVNSILHSMGVTVTCIFIPLFIFFNAKAFASPEQPIDASQEMLSIGISNIVGSFFSSMPVTGSFSRTTVNAMSGAKSPLGGLITGTMVILALRFLTPYFYYIPKASLAAVIVCAVIFMVDLDVLKPMWRSKKMEFVPYLLTFLISLFVGLEFGMMTGFLISVIYLLYYAARPGVKIKKGYTAYAHEFLIVELDRSLTFPSVEYIRYVISKSSMSWGDNKLPMVVDCNHIQFADYTAANGLIDVVKQFKQRGQPIVLYKVKPSIIRILTGVMPSQDWSQDESDWSSKGFKICRSESELEQFIDDVSQTRTRIAVLESMKDGAPHEITTDVHTPFPQHRDKYISTPMN